MRHSQEYNDAFVMRFIVAHNNGTEFAHARQGRYTYDTAEQAQAWIDAAMQNNSASTLNSVFKLPLSVAQCKCWPGHFDPKGWPEPIG